MTAAGRVGAGALGPPLPAPGCGLGCRGSRKGVVDRRGLRPARGAGRSGRWGRGVGGAEPWRGFPELLLLLGLESKKGLGLRPSNPLISAPPDRRAASRIWFSLSDPGLGIWTSDPVLGSSSRLPRPLGLSSGSVISWGPRGGVSLVPGRGEACVDAGDLLQGFPSRPA